MKRKTKAELSDVLHISRQALHRHLARPDAPKPDTAGRFDVPEVRRYVREARALDNALTSQDLLRAKVHKLETETRILRAKLKDDAPAVPIDDLRRFLGDWWREITDAVLDQRNSLPPLVEGRTMADAHDVVEGKSIELLRVLRSWALENAERYFPDKLPIQGKGGR